MLMEHDWEGTFCHTYREGNFAADYLANLVHDYPLGVQLITHPDCNLSYFLRCDCTGTTDPRLVPS
ncbi:hypothetical protein LINPERHAP1_LOCUS19136 [Linum perenne]